MHLYIHIPFCKQACHYCDFHFSTNLGSKGAMIEAISKEIVLQRDYCSSAPLETIYFGGGTPSLLSASELGGLLETIHRYYNVSPLVELTLEANPDDLDVFKIKELAGVGINRLSIGIQSFNDEHLRYLNRAHTAVDAERCVREAQAQGLSNISVDLIYAIPALDNKILENDIERVLSLGTPHISAYCLSIEPKTVFGNRVKQRKMAPVEDEFAAAQFELLTSSLQGNGFEQYEISNFAMNGHYSQHNTSYWKRRPYLGVGPSAHSYNGVSRQWNVSNNAQYLRGMLAGTIPATLEMLTPTDQVNEYLLTGLRTIWGCEVSILESLSANAFMAKQQPILDDLKTKGWLTVQGRKLLLTESGKLFADRVASELFMD